MKQWQIKSDILDFDYLARIKEKVVRGNEKIGSTQIRQFQERQS